MCVFHLWSAPVLQEQFTALKGLGYSHLSDLSMRVLCPLALMEFVPVCPNHAIDFMESVKLSGFHSGRVAFAAITVYCSS